MTLQHDPSFAKLPAASEGYCNFVVDTSARGAITQVTDIPESYWLPAIRNKLVNPNDFDTWLYDVTCILREKNLYRFINVYMERPPRGSPYTKRWLKVSKDIQTWLYQAVSGNINRLVVQTRCVFADEYVEALKQTLRRTPTSKSFVTLWTIRHNQYSTGSEFVEALRDQCARVARRVTISPFFLSQVVLHEILFDNIKMVPARHSNNYKSATNAEDFSATDLYKFSMN
jgi:hypothetical protein